MWVQMPEVDDDVLKDMKEGSMIEGLQKAEHMGS